MLKLKIQEGWEGDLFYIKLLGFKYKTGMGIFILILNTGIPLGYTHKIQKNVLLDFLEEKM